MGPRACSEKVEINPCLHLETNSDCQVSRFLLIPEKYTQRKYQNENAKNSSKVLRCRAHLVTFVIHLCPETQGVAMETNDADSRFLLLPSASERTPGVAASDTRRPWQSTLVGAD